MKTSFFYFLWMAVCLAPMTASAQLEIASVPVVKDKLYNDDSGDKPRYVGQWNGTTITVDYDLNYLQHIIFVGGEIYKHDGSLSVEVDSAANRARFSRAGRHIDVDFGKKDALIRLGYFMSPQKGFKRHNLAYTLKTDKEYCMDYHSAYIAELPDNPALYGPIMDIIAKHFASSVDGDGSTFEKLVRDRAEIDLANSNMDGQRYKGAAPNDLVTFMTGSSNLIEWIPLVINDSTITMNTIINMTYPAGGCMALYDQYDTYRLDKDGSISQLSAKDIFKPEALNDVCKIFLNALVKKYNGYGDLVDMYVKFYDETDSLSDDGIIVMSYDELLNEVQPLVEAGDYSRVSMPRVAIVPDGVMFTYNEQCIEDFGELGDATVLIPLKDIKEYLNDMFVTEQR